MPKLKQPPRDYQQLSELLRGKGVTVTGLSVATGLAINTASKRFHDPGKLTLDNLIRIAKHYSIPVDDIRNVLYK